MLTSIQRTNYSPQLKLQNNNSRKQTQPAFSGVVAKATGGAYGAAKGLVTTEAGFWAIIGASLVTIPSMFSVASSFTAVGLSAIRKGSRKASKSVQKDPKWRDIIKDSAQAFDKWCNKNSTKINLPKIF